MSKKNNTIVPPTTEEKVRQGIIKSERKIAKDGSGYVEKVLNVYGDDLEKIKKVFDEKWKEE
jgi:ribosome recycling factor